MSPSQESRTSYTLGRVLSPKLMYLCLSQAISFPDWMFLARQGQSDGHLKADLLPSTLPCPPPLLKAHYLGSRTCCLFSYSVPGEWGYTSLQHHPASSSSIFYLGLLFMQLSHFLSKLHPNLHSVLLPTLLFPDYSDFFPVDLILSKSIWLYYFPSI